MLFGSRDHGFCHQIGLGDHGLDCHALGAALGFHFVNEFLGGVAPLLLDAFHVNHVNRHAALKIAARVARNHLECHHRGARQGRQGQASFNRLVGQCRTVGGNQNAFVHA